jgi:hypothetical protein
MIINHVEMMYVPSITAPLTRKIIQRSTYVRMIGDPRLKITIPPHNHVFHRTLNSDLPHGLKDLKSRYKRSIEN